MFVGLFEYKCSLVVVPDALETTPIYFLVYSVYAFVVVTIIGLLGTIIMLGTIIVVVVISIAIALLILYVRHACHGFGYKPFLLFLYFT